MNRQRRINAAAPAPLSTFDVSKAERRHGAPRERVFCGANLSPRPLLRDAAVGTDIAVLRRHLRNLLTAAALDRIISDLVCFWVSGGRLALVMRPGNCVSTAAFAVPASAYFPENNSEP